MGSPLGFATAHWGHERWGETPSSPDLSQRQKIRARRSLAPPGSWKASTILESRIETMNRCASQRRGPDRGSATRSLPGSWKGAED